MRTFLRPEVRNDEPREVESRPRLPERAAFFISYLLLNGLAKYPVYLCRAAYLASYAFSHHCLTPATPRAHRRLRDPEKDQLDYTAFVPNMLLMFVITATYAVIQPLHASETIGAPRNPSSAYSPAQPYSPRRRGPTMLSTV